MSIRFFLFFISGQIARGKTLLNIEILQVVFDWHLVGKAKFQVYEASLSIKTGVVAARATGNLGIILHSLVKCMSNRPALQERTDYYLWIKAWLLLLGFIFDEWMCKGKGRKRDHEYLQLCAIGDICNLLYREDFRKSVWWCWRCSKFKHIITEYKSIDWGLQWLPILVSRVIPSRYLILKDHTKRTKMAVIFWEMLIRMLRFLSFLAFLPGLTLQSNCCLFFISVLPRCLVCWMKYCTSTSLSEGSSIVGGWGGDINLGASHRVCFWQRAYQGSGHFP